MRSNRRLRGAFVAGLLGATALGGFAAFHGVLADTTAPAAAIAPAAPPAVLPDFAALVARVEPAVVTITSKLDVHQAADEGQGMQQMPFGFRMPPGMQRPERGHAVEARGSGFLIDADGSIVTNNHVVKDATAVTVTLADGTQLPAKVIGRDERSDLAVLRISAGRKLPFIDLGDSSKVRPGEWVVAVGNPFGLGGTVTAGIVSALGRDIGSGPYDDFIQIDAPINQGNSGGPLFTQDGHVVGVNSAILSPTGGSVGIGFAIPSNMVRTVVADLEKDGHVTRGYLGVEAQPVNTAMATALHLGGQNANEGGGALIAGELRRNRAAPGAACSRATWTAWPTASRSANGSSWPSARTSRAPRRRWKSSATARRRPSRSHWRHCRAIPPASPVRHTATPASAWRSTACWTMFVRQST